MSPVVKLLPVGYGIVTYHFTSANLAEEAVCTTAANFSTEPTAAVADALFDSWQDNLLVEMSNSYSLNRCEILYQAEAIDQIRVVSTQAAAAGGQAGSVNPPNVALLLEKRTALAGRANLGRCYVPGIVETDVGNDGAITAARLATWGTQATDWLNAFNGAVGVDEMVLLHSCFHEDDDPPCVPRAPTIITSITVDPFAATQRRRLR